MYHMNVDEFEDILKEFPQTFDCVKSLCKEIRGLLFPYKNDLLIGTPLESSKMLYDSIIEAFDNTIASISTRGDSK